MQLHWRQTVTTAAFSITSTPSQDGKGKQESAVLRVRGVGTTLRESPLTRRIFLTPHILPKEQDAIAMAQLAVEAMAHPQDGAVDHHFDMLRQLA